MDRLLSPVRRHPWRALSVATLVVLAGGAFLARDVIRLTLAPEAPIDATLPVVPALSPAPDEVVYRVDASRSELHVGVDEVLAGAERRVELTTKAIAGDVAVSSGATTEVRLGEVAVDVHQLRSDNNLRDKALHHEFLESHRYPEVRLRETTVELPADATPTSVSGATLEGTLEVKGQGYPVEWEVDARVVGDTLTATATTRLSMSELGVGPISKAGLVRSSDEVDLRLQLVAVDGRSFEPPVGLVSNAVDARADGEGEGPSFASDVQPVLEANCASCHATGEIGASMWTLDTAGDAAEVADGLAVVTQAGYMPPWPASDVGVEVHNARGLSDDDIATMAEWAAAGGPLDVDPATPVDAPDRPEIRLPRPDRVVKMAEAYKGTPEELDDYRCFVLDPQVTEPSFLTAYTFDPDQLAVVHHSIVSRVRQRDVAAMEEKDRADDGPGWSCLAGMGASTGDRVAGWVPGQRPVVFREGEGFDLQPGDVLVAQIHYHYDPDTPPDRSGMTLELEPASPEMTALQSRSLIGPVELPCPTGTDGELCDRDAALVDINERFGPGAAGIANGLHFLCGTTPEEVAATFDGNVGTTTCDYQVRQGAELIGMLGHMHEIGSSYRLTLQPDTPEETVLLDIPVWNFAWQLAYSPVEEVRLEAGDVLRVRCQWDRRLRHETDPAYIVFAEGTLDEMCFSTLTLRPDPPPG
jgi:mono/diheme cytochrome c family protein